jgi:tRNA-splicing ligase RtcB
MSNEEPEFQGDELRTRYSGMPLPRVEKEGKNLFTVKATGKMLVPVKIFSNDTLIKQLLTDDSLRQACNVAALPGIVGASIVMPDAHQGYGFCIGGVAAFDPDCGIISPGGIGFDINCGVRMLATNLTREDILPRIKELVGMLYQACPVGTGEESRVRLTDEDINSIAVNGAKWAVEKGYGSEDDLEHCEALGCLPEADPAMITQRARTRGRGQIGTVGAGNHFVEVQTVDEIYRPDVASAFGITRPGQVVIMIHCGSRGFGHQICTDYIRSMEEAQPELTRNLADHNLIHAPLGHELATKYWGAMNAAANFAFCNRHILAHNVRDVFRKLFGDHVTVKTVYDVCHNIAKRETHTVEGAQKMVLVHRKGATRAFPPGHAEVPLAYRAVGQPVIIPGSMGTASYVLVGTETAMRESFGSTAHGAGRTMSRLRAKRDYPADVVKADLDRKGVTIKAASLKGISEEAPGAYKDVDEVINVSDDAGIAKRVARMVPIGVIKG